MKECLDGGMLQSFFDGELPADMMEQAARHIASCNACRDAARELESENAIFLAAIEPEMSAGVPTEKLRLRITAAIAEMDSPARPLVPESTVSVPWLASVAALFRFTPLRATAYATILAVILLGSIFAAVKLRTEPEASRPQIAQAAPRDTVIPVPADNPGSSPTNDQSDTRVANSGSRSRHSLSNKGRAAGVKLIPGEESYLRTIAGLDVGLKGGQGSMSPTTRAEFERNLKLVDYAIAATRSKAKQTPHDPDAAGFMFAAYQSKIDLLSTMTETARLTPH